MQSELLLLSKGIPLGEATVLIGGILLEIESLSEGILVVKGTLLFLLLRDLLLPNNLRKKDMRVNEFDEREIDVED